MTGLLIFFGWHLELRELLGALGLLALYSEDVEADLYNSKISHVSRRTFDMAFAARSHFCGFLSTIKKNVQSCSMACIVQW